MPEQLGRLLVRPRIGLGQAQIGREDPRHEGGEHGRPERLQTVADQIRVVAEYGDGESRGLQPAGDVEHGFIRSEGAHPELDETLHGHPAAQRLDAFLVGSIAPESTLIAGHGIA